jgi:hypothetical protein
VLGAPFSPLSNALSLDFFDSLYPLLYAKNLSSFSAFFLFLSSSQMRKTTMGKGEVLLLDFRG